MAAYTEAALTREFGVSWRARADGAGQRDRGRDRRGVQAVLRAHGGHQQDDAAARAGVGAAERQAADGVRAAAHPEEGHDADPGREGGWLDRLGPEDRRLGPAAGQGPRCPAVGHRAPGAASGRQVPAPEHGGPPSPEKQRQAIQDAVEILGSKRSTWTRAEFMRTLQTVLPPEVALMDPADAAALVDALAEKATSGAVADVVPMEAPEWPALPDDLRREVDGRCVYTRPGVQRYAARAAVDLEQRLVADAQRPARAAYDARGDRRRVGDRPAAPGGGAAGERRGGHGAAGQRAAPGPGRRADARAVVAEGVRGAGWPGRDRQDAVGCRGRQPVGSPRWPGDRDRDEPERDERAAGGRVPERAEHNAAADPAGRGQVRVGHADLGGRGQHGVDGAPGQDRGVRGPEHGCKVVVSGDQQQLAAVESGGGMMLLANRMGFVQLSTPQRFAATWEQDASLRLRDGDATALDEYQVQGRVRGGDPVQVMREATRAYVAEHIAGHDVILTAQSWDRCRELSRMIRGDLKHLGMVDDGRTVELSRGPGGLGRRPDHRAGERPRARSGGAGPWPGQRGRHADRARR